MASPLNFNPSRRRSATGGGMGLTRQLPDGFELISRPLVLRVCVGRDCRWIPYRRLPATEPLWRSCGCLYPTGGVVTSSPHCSPNAGTKVHSSWKPRYRKADVPEDNSYSQAVSQIPPMIDVAILHGTERSVGDANFPAHYPTFLRDLGSDDLRRASNALE